MRSFFLKIVASETIQSKRFAAVSGSTSFRGRTSCCSADVQASAKAIPGPIDPACFRSERAAEGIFERVKIYIWRNRFLYVVLPIIADPTITNHWSFETKSQQNRRKPLFCRPCALALVSPKLATPEPRNEATRSRLSGSAAASPRVLFL